MARVPPDSGHVAGSRGRDRSQGPQRPEATSTSPVISGTIIIGGDAVVRALPSGTAAGGPGEPREAAGADRGGRRHRVRTAEGPVQDAHRRHPHHRHGHHRSRHLPTQISNLNRQFLFKAEHKGKSKALTAKETIRALNPLLKVEAHHRNIRELPVPFFRQFDYLIMALDNIETRYGGPHSGTT